MSRLRAKPKGFIDDDLRELGDLLMDVGLPKRAIVVYTMLLKRRPEDAGAWHALSVARFESGDETGGLIAARRAIRIQPDHLAALHNAAMALMHRGEWERSLAYIRRGLKVDPDDTLLRRLTMTLRIKRALARVRPRKRARV